MKIILEGTEAELRNAIRSFGIPNEAIFDDGNEFVAQNSRRKNCTITKLSPEIKETVDNMLSNGCTYSLISQYLKSLEISLSRQAISNYRRNYFQKSMPIKDELIPFNCGDIGGRGHRCKKVERTFKDFKEQYGNTINNYLPQKEVPDKPKPCIDLDIMAENASKLNPL